MLKQDEVLIEQNGSDNDIYLIFVGTVNIVVNGRIVGRRGPGDSVGEMAAIEPTQRRSASVIAVEETLVAVIAEPDLAEIAGRHPQIYRSIAKELARRLVQRNALVSAARDRVRVFIISSAEALPVARIVQNAFAHDAFTPIVWTDDVFKVSNYTLQTLEDALNDCDFAIAIAHSDDMTECRGKEWPAPRDNVIFELGLFMGRHGKERAVLMEPRDDGVKLPSDLAGITTVGGRFQALNLNFWNSALGRYRLPVAHGIGLAVHVHQNTHTDHLSAGVYPKILAVTQRQLCDNAVHVEPISCRNPTRI